jgi:hypothetical protein
VRLWPTGGHIDHEPARSSERMRLSFAMIHQDAFYDPRSASVFRAGRNTVGPWAPTLQHGGPPAALLGRAVEQLGAPGLRIARLAFDFFSPVPVADLSIMSEVLRPGKRIQLSSAILRAGDRNVMRVSAWHVRAEPGRSPPIPTPFAVPELPPSSSEARFTGMDPFPYGLALEWRFVTGSFAESGPATVWTRCLVPLVTGEPLTGLQRVLVMVDAANGISAELSPLEWTFVPIDLLVVLERSTADEWVGMSARTSMTADGIGLTDTILFDSGGAFGRALQTLFVAPK